MGYIHETATIQTDQEIKIKNINHTYDCSNSKLSIHPIDSNSNFSFTGNGKNTLFGKIYSNQDDRNSVSVNFKNPFIYLINISLICLFISTFLYYRKIINPNYVLISSILLTFITYFIEYKNFLSGSSPSIFRILQFTTLISWVLLQSSCFEFLCKFKKISIFIFIFTILFFYFQDHVLSMHPSFGRHFFFLLNSIIHNYSFSMGSIEANGLFHDALVFDGRGFMPNNFGPVLFPLFFGSELLKLGFLILSFVIVSNFYLTYKYLYPSNLIKSNENIFVFFIILVLFPLVLLSGTYYPSPNFGAGLFVSFAIREFVKKIMFPTMLLFF